MSFDAFHEFERAGWEDESVVEHYEKQVGAVTAQCNGVLLDAAGVRAGSRVLDVACGPGHLTAAAAELGASAVGIDFSRAQVAAARRARPGLRFDVADAGRLPFGDGTFDAVLCSFGMLHFPDPLAAAVEARRVLAPAGRFAFTVWDVPEQNVAMGAVLRALRAHGTTDVDIPPGPDFFELSDPNRSAQLLLEAGFESPRVERVGVTWRLPDPELAFDAFERATVRLGAVLRAQSPARKDRIRAALREEFRPHCRDGFCELPMPALLAAGSAVAAGSSPSR